MNNKRVTISVDNETIVKCKQIQGKAISKTSENVSFSMVIDVAVKIADDTELLKKVIRSLKK